MSAADKKSNPSQIAQSVLDEANQAVKVTIVSGGTGVGADVNLTDIKGVDVDVNTGNATAGTQRVVLASDQPAIPVDIQDTSIAVSLLYTEDSVTIYAPNNNTTAIPVSGSIDIVSLPGTVQADIGAIKTAIESVNTKTTGPVALRFDNATDPIAYKGEANAGTATSAATWRISRITAAGDGSVTIEWADGNPNFDNIWNNRTSLSYS
jgi:hypothetical protein